MHCRLEKYSKSINSITEHQHGFRPKSNVTATADHVTKMKYNIDSKNITLSIFIVLKRSDTVNHKIPLQKLEAINIPGTFLKMFESYSNYRKQIVRIDRNF